MDEMAKKNRHLKRQNKVKNVMIRLTEEEYELYSAAAQAEDRKLTPYLVRIIKTHPDHLKAKK